ARAPYREWLREGELHASDEVREAQVEALPAAELQRCRKLYGLTREAAESFVKVLGETGTSPIGAMGDDTPVAGMSGQTRSLYDYFRQGFAQVTNPPIDPLRERAVMSLATRLGTNGNVFAIDPSRGRQVVLPTPLLSTAALQELLALPRFSGRVLELDLCATGGEDLDAALERLCRRAVAAARSGPTLVCLSDRRPREGVAPVHALAATGAVHARLVAEGLRGHCHILVDTGTVFESHHLACLIGYGATAVCPWLAWKVLRHMSDSGQARSADGFAGVVRHYRQGMLKGLLKILSKAGIATVSGYRGAQLFEIVGLADD